MTDEKTPKSQQAPAETEPEEKKAKPAANHADYTAGVSTALVDGFEKEKN